MTQLLQSLGNPLVIGWMTLDWWLLAVAVLLTAFAAGHALLNKRHPQAALGWIAVVGLLPFYGPILYGLLGVNRVRKRAQALDYDWQPPPASPGATNLPASRQRLATTARSITGAALCGGNQVTPLFGGEAAYEPMLEAIEDAAARVWLATYIFDADQTGYQFIDALDRARRRGADVRVIVDGIGALYSRPRITGRLRRRKIPTAQFLPPTLLPPSFHINLRNHRKLLIVDEATAFTGGMNIGDRHLLTRPDNPAPTQDIHFRIDGPITTQLAHLYAHDWRFATGGQLPQYAPKVPEAVAPVWCRTVVDGPDENLDRLRSLILAAISNANQRVRIMTPYFLPSAELMAAMSLAVLAGVSVEVVLPSRSNLRIVDWAMGAVIPRLSARGIRFWLQPGPFAHSKLLLIDEDYALVGSANLDARSLRLNFEVGLEIYDAGVTRILNRHFDEVMEHSTKLEPPIAPGLVTRLRDGAAWLLSPYL